MVGTEICSQAITGVILAAHEYSANHYVAAVTDSHNMVRSVYFTADPESALISDIELNPGYFTNVHKAMAFGLRYV